MPRRLPDSVKELLTNQQWLVDMHVHQLFSIVEIATQLQVTPGVVSKALKSFNIVSPSQQSLREASNVRKYGVANPGAVKEFREKALATMQDKYGGHNWASGNRGKRDQTCLERYGDANVGRTEYAKDKAKRTNQFLYGRDHINQQHHASDVYLKLNDKEWLVDQHITQRKTLSQIAEELGFGNDMTTVMRHLHKHGIETKYHQTSHMENQVADFIASLEVEVSRNTRAVIPPKELDIYVPSSKLAIEFCGVYWHSEGQGKHRLYHRQKYLACKEQGIQLITMYDWEWNTRQFAAKRKLETLLHRNNNAVYARACEVRSVSTPEKQEFLDRYHIQGAGPGSITYGLYHADELVAVMTFVRGSEEFTLNRFATSIRVVGGFTKLLTHFKRNHPWKRIVSFADLRWSDGSLYERTGFTLEAELPPDYAYIVGNQPMHKFAFRHKSLSSKLPNYDPALTEWENMRAHGYDRIWDCGKLRYALTNRHTHRNTHEDQNRFGLAP